MSDDELKGLIQRLQGEADLCRNDGADDIAALVDEAADALERLTARAEQAEAERDALRAFALEVLEGHPHSYPDGFDIQDAAIKHGLFIAHKVTAPCREEGCNCAEYHGAEDMADGVECFRRAPVLMDAARGGEAGK